MEKGLKAFLINSLNFISFLRDGSCKRHGTHRSRGHLSVSPLFKAVRCL